MDLTARAKEIIASIKYITIATVNDLGQPWNSPVYCAFDQYYNFYWNSWIQNQHSINIAKNPKIFIVIYDSTVSEGAGEGVYMIATAHVITDPNEIEIGRRLMENRNQKPTKKIRDPKEFMGTFPRRVYKATPTRAWMNIDGEIDGNFVDKRSEVFLPFQNNLKHN